MSQNSTKSSVPNLHALVASFLASPSPRFSPHLAFRPPPPASPISSLAFPSSSSAMPASLLTTTTDQPIYYVFSNRIPNLLQSTSQPHHLSDFQSRLTQSPPTELQQRDRLCDSQVYLKVINCSEIRLAIQLAIRKPCDFVILYLASLLRVSIYLRHANQTHLTSPATTSPVFAPFRPKLHKPPPKRLLHL